MKLKKIIRFIIIAASAVGFVYLAIAGVCVPVSHLKLLSSLACLAIYMISWTHYFESKEDKK